MAQAFSGSERELSPAMTDSDGHAIVPAVTEGEYLEPGSESPFDGLLAWIQAGGGTRLTASDHIHDFSGISLRCSICDASMQDVAVQSERGAQRRLPD
jgi:hypothetical protein